MSLWLLLGLFVTSLCAEGLANSRPLLLRYRGQLYLPVLFSYPETTFGGEFETEAEYRDPYVQEKIAEKGWMIWPPIPFSHNTINLKLTQPAPAPPSA